MYLVCSHEYDCCSLFAIWDNKDDAINHAKQLFIDNAPLQKRMFDDMNWIVNWDSAAVTHYGVEWIAFNTPNMKSENNVTVFSTSDSKVYTQLATQALENERKRCEKA